MSIGPIPFPILQSLAADFRYQYAFDPNCPGTLQAAVDKMDHVLVKKLPDLSRATIEAWLAQANIPINLPFDNRPLYGFCLVHKELAIVFIDARSQPAQQEFTLAHELAHYLLEYCWPRIRATKGLGQEAGRHFGRPKDLAPQTRILGALLGLPLRAPGRLLEQTELSAMARYRIATAEGNADRLAYELLAPSHLFGKGDRGCSHKETRMKVFERLTTGFSFPYRHANAYASSVADQLYGKKSMQELLGLS